MKHIARQQTLDEYLMHTPDKLDARWIVSTAHILNSLARIRHLALAIPMTLDSYAPTNSVVQAVWDLEDQMRWCIRIDAQRAKRGGRRKEDDSAEGHAEEVYELPEKPTYSKPIILPSAAENEHWQTVREKQLRLRFGGANG